MPGRWDDKAEKDLMYAMIMTLNGDGNIRVPWDKVKEHMEVLGHDFTASAMSQRFTKVIIKEMNNSKTGDGNDGNGMTNSSTSAPGAPGRKRKIGKAATASANADGNDEDEESNPAKKPKKAATKKVSVGDQKAELEDNEAALDLLAGGEA